MNVPNVNLTYTNCFRFIYSFLDGLLLGRSCRLKRAKSANAKRKWSSPGNHPMLIRDDSGSSNSEDMNFLNSTFGGKNSEMAVSSKKHATLTNNIFKFDKKSARKPRFRSAPNK